MCHCFVGVFSFYFIYLSLGQISQLGDTFYKFFYFIVDWSMRKEVEERVEVPELPEERVEGREEEEEIQESQAIVEAVAEEEERCEEDPESHSSAKRARVCATFTDTQEVSIVEFVKQHPELYDKEHPRFHDRTRRETLWAEIAAELHLQPFDVRRWFESQRTRYGKLSKLQSGQAPREMTKRQSWVYQQMGFLKTHIRRKGANRSSGFEASPNTSTWVNY